MIEDPRTAAEVNRLYWDTDASVAEIAEQLGVSRRALYATLRAESAGARCSACGSELVFGNRSARSSGLATCSGCGAEETVSAEAVAAAPGGEDADLGWSDRLAELGSGRGAWIFGGLAAGALVGAAAAWLVVRRR